MKKASQPKLPTLIFVAAAIVFVISCWIVWAEIQQRSFCKLESTFHFLLFNSLIAAVFLSSPKPLACEREDADDADVSRREAEVDRMEDVEPYHEAETEKGVRVFEDVDSDEESSEDDAADDEIASAELRRRADEFIAKVVKGWMDERTRETSGSSMTALTD
ncbi:hypothetical protein HPP92_014272 [Vanilla planifolia]|uniref:Transmembrane protein n=1 Tax=Vanilla planifolia TaxID=51239 RepID=A0A835QP55_VANPL|nr:hypothetical protein HPP92_014677 [Vanilla planifolia]KAG0474586.1 hypothetical protein HPP92_014272 [Vanilla planifolia]